VGIDHSSLLVRLAAAGRRLLVAGWSVSTLQHEYPRRASRDRYGNQDDTAGSWSGPGEARSRQATELAGWAVPPSAAA
jgi:hypothetical protein